MDNVPAEGLVITKRGKSVARIVSRRKGHLQTLRIYPGLDRRWGLVKHRHHLGSGTLSLLNLDTHVVIHFLNGDLSQEETNSMAGQDFGISAIVLWEIAKLHQLGRITRGIEDGDVAKFLRGCKTWQIDAPIALASTSLDFQSDLADVLIAATSAVHQVPLLTRDSKLRSSKMVPLALP